MAGANGWSVILSPAPVDELAFEGTLRIPDAHSEIAALSPVEAGANLRSSLIPRDSQTVSIAPTDSATSTLGADFQAFSFTPVRGLRLPARRACREESPIRRSPL